jgi:hypothetical protein
MYGAAKLALLVILCQKYTTNYRSAQTKHGSKNDNDVQLYDLCEVDVPNNEQTSREKF